MQTYIKRIRNQNLFLTSVKLKKKALNKFFQAKNLDLYYENLHIKSIIIFVNNAKIILRLQKLKIINKYTL